MNLDPRLADAYHRNLPTFARQYLNDRGIPDSQIARAQLGWNGTRIAIPVFDRETQLALFKLGRAPDDTTDSPKMLYHPPGTSAELYGWDTVRLGPSAIIICEGEYDRLVLEARGFPAVTGTGGAGVFKEEWSETVVKIPYVYVCYDNDEAGRAGARRVANLIPHARIATLPPEVGEGGDVTDFFVRLQCTRHAFAQLLNDSRPLPEADPRERPAPRRTREPPPDSDIARLKSALKIEEIIGQYVTLRRSGRALMARCCFHEERNPSLAVFPDTQSFYCFGCHKHGDVISFLMEVERLTFAEAVRVLRRLAPFT